MTYKTYKQDDSKKILAMIRKAIAQHRADIADKLNVDSPAIARNDHHGKPVIDKANHLGGARLRHTAKKQQFQKLHSEAAEDDKMDPGNTDDAKVGRGREKMDGKEKENDPVNGKVKTGKTGDIVMYPDEKEYGNAEGAQKVMDTRAESFTEQYKAWLDEVRSFGDGAKKLPGRHYNNIAESFRAAAPISNDNTNPDPLKPSHSQVAHVKHFYDKHIVHSPGNTMTAIDLHDKYIDYCKKHKHEPLALPTFGREFGKLGVLKAKVSGRVRHIDIATRP